jgi:raffinose/stachyose/melibiose transport system substrate-binding protein
MKSSARARNRGGVSRREFLYTVPAATLVIAGGLASSARAQAPAVRRGYQGKLTMYAKRPLEQGFQKIVDDFKAGHPGVDLVWNYAPIERWVAGFTAAQFAGEQTDMLMPDGQFLRSMVAGNQLLDLTDISFKSRFRPIAMESHIINNRLWALPIEGMTGWVIFTNRAILKKLGLPYPETIADLVAMKGEFKKAGIAPFTHAGQLIFYWPVWFFTAYQQTTGDQAVQRTIACLKGERKFTDPDVVAAFDAVFNLGRQGLFIEGVTTLDRDGAMATFVNGKAAFWLMFTSYIQNVRKAAPRDLDFDVEIPPQLTSQKAPRRFPGGIGSSLAIPQKIDGSRKDIAIEFFEFATRDEYIDHVCRSLGTALGTTITSKGGADPVTPKLAGMLENFRLYLDWFWPPEVTNTFRQSLQAGILGQKTPEQAAKDVQATFDKLVAGGYKYIG